MTLPGPVRLNSWERGGLALLGLFVVAFGIITEINSAFSNSRKTDLGVYLRAAWAVRTGADIYQITDNNRYHYTYPPAFAVLMLPLADAPAGASRSGLLPFWASVAIWTMLNFALVGRMAHVLATLALPEEPRGSRRWWYARTIPLYIAFGGIGYSIGFGQVNVLLVALLVEMLRASLAGKSMQSGLWLATAIVIKVFPAYLLLYPLVRRDFHALSATATGLLIGLGAIPLAAFGHERTATAYRGYVQNVLMPGALGTGNIAGLKELINLPSNDSQSFLAVIHSNLYPNRLTMPGDASRQTRLAHNIISAFVTLFTVAVAWRRGLPTASDAMIFLGLLMLLMLHVAPMSHMHYYAFGYVLAAGIWLKGMAHCEAVNPGWRIWLPLTAWALGTAIPLLPGETCAEFRFRGMGLASSLMLWVVGLREVGRVQTAIKVELPATLPFVRPAVRKAA